MAKYLHKTLVAINIINKPGRDSEVVAEILMKWEYKDVTIADNPEERFEISKKPSEPPQSAK